MQTTAERLERPRVMGNIISHRAMEGERPIVVSRISQKEVQLMNEQKESTARRQLLDLAAWTYRVAKVRPFINTKYEEEKKKFFKNFEEKNGRPPSRKEKKHLRVEAAASIARQYRNKKF